MSRMLNSLLALRSSRNVQVLTARRPYCSSSRGEDDGPASPLSTVRILDLSSALAGPFCTMLLGDLGADVIKVEPPGCGELSRKWGPPFLNGESCYFLSANRNKKSVAVDIKTPDGRDIVLKLVRDCDVLVENFIPGKLESLGLGYSELRDFCPQLVHCSVTGYGRDGPYSARPGLDAIAGSIGGLFHVTGPDGGAPCKPGIPTTDLATGLYAHGAIMAALIQRGVTGRGQSINCNLLATQISWLTNQASSFLNAGVEARRLGTGHPNLVPYQSFKTLDGYLTIGCSSDKNFKELCDVLGCQDLVTDAKFQTNEMRVTHRHELMISLEKMFIKEKTAEWLQRFEGCQIPYGSVNNLEQVFKDPHVVHGRMVREIDHPTAGKVKVLAPAVTYSEALNAVRLPPPTLGQHTTEVLGQFYSPSEIEEFHKRGIIQGK